MVLYKILIFSFIFLLTVPVGYAGTVSVTTLSKQVESLRPVDKVKPIEKRNKLRNKFRKKRRLQRQNEKNTDSSTALITILTIFSFVLFMGGAVLFGFGPGILLMWVIGLILMGLANLFPWILILTNKNEDEVIAKNLKTIFLVFLILNFLAGLIFLVFGLTTLFLLFSIVGIILLALAMLIFLFWFVFSNH
jgi:hypothetical protein